ncbi:MAG: S41 family peptidase [Leptospirales bacterium]|nr:S41 family peptidase [Leptospirales bacterium]
MNVMRLIFTKLIVLSFLLLSAGLAAAEPAKEKTDSQQKPPASESQKGDAKTQADAQKTDLENSHIYQNVFQQVFFLIQNYHVDQTTRKKLLEGAIRGMLESTGDPYSRFLGREEHKDFNHSEGGDLVGIGVEVTIQNGTPLIIAPVPGGPAEKAGLQSGDKILSIGGEPTRYVGITRLSEMITGEPGSIVQLGILRGNAQFSVRVERGVFQLDYVKSSILAEGKVGYLRLQAFFGEDSGSVQKFKSILQDFQSRGLTSVVLDLRNNSGGHVEMARILSGYFLKKGDVVYRVRSRTEQKEFAASGDTELISPKVKLIILINRGSASASEILAGCLQDHKRAILLGDQSFGKASVQQVFRPLPDDTAVLITTQRYYTPLNRSLHGVGLRPDILVPDIVPTPQESVYLGTIEEKKFLEEFLKQYPEYNESLLEKFQAFLKKQSIQIRPELSRLILRREYGVRSPDPDVKSDPQLARALKELVH